MTPELKARIAYWKGNGNFLQGEKSLIECADLIEKLEARIVELERTVATFRSAVPSLCQCSECLDLVETLKEHA